MTSQTVDGANVVAALEALRHELSRLNDRVAALETTAGGAPRAAAPAPAPAPAAKAEGPAAVVAERLDEELVTVLGAAIAAFLGKKPRIRQIQLLGSAPWAQEGRSTIQASHALSVHHG
jgi:methylmalonyl-CoA carboxyltransferase 12S subunit